MKSLSLRKIRNIFNRKEKNYASTFNNCDIEYELLLGSCINVNADHFDLADIQCTMSQLVVKFIVYDNDTSGREQLTEFYTRCIECSIPIFFKKDGDKTIVIVSSCFDNLAYLISTIDREHMEDNTFINTIDDLTSMFVFNRAEYNNDEMSFELVDPNGHRSFRRRYDDFIEKDSTMPIEILGYSWIFDDEIGKLNRTINCIWLSIHPSILNEFIELSIRCYTEDNGRILIKTSLADFIEAINNSVSSISNDTFNSIRNIFSLDSAYFKPLSPLIRWNRYTGEDDDNYEDDNDDYKDEEEHEITQDEFINAAIDEIIK